jgi:hypothetical protein
MVQLTKEYPQMVPKANNGVPTSGLANKGVPPNSTAKN